MTLFARHCASCWASPFTPRKAFHPEHLSCAARPSCAAFTLIELLLETSAPNPLYSSHMNGITWDSATQGTVEFALTRHSDGFNNGYLSGHRKWAKWSQVWFQTPAGGVWQGTFDPRQL